MSVMCLAECDYCHDEIVARVYCASCANQRAALAARAWLTRHAESLSLAQREAFGTFVDDLTHSKVEVKGAA